ncbi:MAG: hypothetical protein H0W30_05735, partial [Gemmatimonadaceae bacterium]|nr:hypothetical protein [Gemmatimonadaceae bacterium]
MISRNSLQILLPSIIDPSVHRGGAGTVTRAILQLLGQDPLGAQIEQVLPASTQGRFHRARQLA